MGKGGHEKADHGLYFVTSLVATPFVLRSVGDWTISYLLDRYCDLEKKDFVAHLVGKGNTKVTIGRIWDGDVTWNNAQIVQGLNRNAALLVSFTRLVFWHWMQPMMYFWALYAGWGHIGDEEKMFARGVALREGIYLLLTLVALCVNPSYLLVDLRSSWRETRTAHPNAKSDVITYVFAPERYVAGAIAKGSSNGFVVICLGMLPIFDLFSILALMCSISHGKDDGIYVPLLVGYSVTACGHTYVIILWCARNLCGFCGGNDERNYDRLTYSQTLGCVSCFVCVIVIPAVFFAVVSGVQAVVPSLFG